MNTCIQKIVDRYHDFMWKKQYKSCLCEYSPKDDKIYYAYVKKAREYGTYVLPNQPKGLAQFEKQIDSWLIHIPMPGHPDWEKVWLDVLLECDQKIKKSKTKKEVDTYQSIKDLYVGHKKSMEEKHQEHLHDMARRCHCPKHRYTKNSD